MESLTKILNGQCSFEEGEFEEMDNELYEENLPLSAELDAIHIQDLSMDLVKMASGKEGNKKK